MIRILLPLLFLAFLAGCADAPVVDCKLTKVAELPLEVQDQLLVVPVGINGKWVRLVVDTGAERTTLSSAAVERLSLPHDSRFTTRATGVGGTTTTTDVSIERMVVGDKRFPVTRMAVGTFTLKTERGLNADGLLGADILLGFDLDIDVPNGLLTLYRSKLCPAPAIPWPEPAVEIVGVRAKRDRLLLPFTLDGVSGMGILDTGAQRNVIGLDTARRLGLDERAMATDRTVRQHGIGPAETIAHVHHFKLLRIGPTAQLAPWITVLPSETGVGDALIGEEFLQGRRVWLSFANRQAFVTLRPGE